MTRLSNFAFAFAVAWATACGGNSSAKKDTTPPNLGADGTTGGDTVVAAPALPVIPAEPVPAPASLLAEISLGNPNMQLGQIGSFVDAVQPGMGAMLTPEQMLGGLGSIVGADALVGVDLEKPVYVLVHDDKVVPGGFVLVVPVADEAALRGSVEGGAQPPAPGAPTPGKAMILLHDGYAAIGQRAALEAGAPYGLTTRLQANTVPELQVRVHMKSVMANYGEQLATQLQTQMGPGAENVVGAMRQIDELVGTVVVDHTAAGLELSAKIASGGTLSQFIAAQQPSTFSMVPHVGTGPWPMFVAGYLDTSTLAPAMAELAKAMAGPMADQMAGMMNIKGGELAVGSNVTAGSVEQLIAVFDSADAVTLQAQADEVMKLLAGKSKDLGTAEIDVTFKANAIKVRGGSLHSITYKPKKSLTPERKKALAETFGKRGLTAYFGVVGSRFIAVYGKDAQKLARQVAKPKASAKGKGVQLQSAIDTAQARGESLLMAFDLAALAGTRPAKDVAPLVVGVSFGADRADLRISMPVEQVKELQAQGM